MNNKKVLILGCGWAGKITADLFLKNNFSVWGSTTQYHKQDELKANGICPVLLDFTQDEISEQSLISLKQQDFDFIIISIPVRRNEEPSLCLHKFKNICQFLSNFKDIPTVYLSSIGVYKPIVGTITETSEVKEDGNIFMIEEFLKNQIQNLVVLRLGGLFGYGRIPGRYFSNKICTVGQEKANYVHGTDVANALYTVWKKRISQTTYNLVAPHHPLKKDIYEQMARKYNFLPVLYGEDTSVQKEVSSEKIIGDLDYKFEIPSPLNF